MRKLHEPQDCSVCHRSWSYIAGAMKLYNLDEVLIMMRGEG